VAGTSFLFIVLAIILGTHSLLAFFSIEGLFVVVGGVIAVAFLSFEASDVHKALDAIKTLFKEPTHDLQNDLQQGMEEIVSWARIINEKDMRGLEERVGKRGVANPFVKYGLNMVVSGYSPEDVRAMMETAADATYERESIPVDVLQAMTSHAPAFGMVGTLVGMVAMLCNLTDNVSGIGASLSVSFLSTLYGVVSARMIYMPAAAKLRQTIEHRRFRNHLVTEGMVMLVAKKTPMYIQDRLNSFLTPDRHDYYDYFGTNKATTMLSPSKAAAMMATHLKIIKAQATA